MAPSLKERYDQRQLQLLQEHTRAADAQLLQEQQTAELLLEAMDPEDLQKVTAIVQKLDTIKSPELPHLSQAIEQAQAELNKYTGGGPIAAAWSKLKTKVGIDNPVVKVTTFADALERGFSQIPTILKNNGVDLAKTDLNKSLSTTLQTQQPTGAGDGEGGTKSNVTGKANDKEDLEYKPTPKKIGAKSDEELGKARFGDNRKNDETHYDIPGPSGTQPGTKPGTAPATAKKPPPAQRTGGQDQPPKPAPGVKKPLAASRKISSADEGHNLDEAGPSASVSGDQKLKNIVAQIRKALAPGGLFGAFKRIPYIDSAALAQELVQAPIKVFSNVAKRIQAGAKASEIAPDMRNQIQGQGDQQTKHANTATPTKQAGQSQPGQPAKPTTATTDTTSTGQQPPKGPGEKRGGGAEAKSPSEAGGTSPSQKAQQFRSGLDKIYKGAGVDANMGQKLLKYLINNKLLDRGAVETHGAGEPKAA